MNSRSLILAFTVAFIGSASDLSAQKPAATTSPPLAKNAKAPTEFDSFIVVLLVRPPDAPEILKPELDKLQEGHMATINRLATEGKLLKAGPLEDFSGRNVRGIFIGRRTRSTQPANGSAAIRWSKPAGSHPNT